METKEWLQETFQLIINEQSKSASIRDKYQGENSQTYNTIRYESTKMVMKGLWLCERYGAVPSLCPHWHEDEQKRRDRSGCLTAHTMALSWFERERKIQWSRLHLIPSLKSRHCLQALNYSTQIDTIDDLFKDLYGHSRTWAQIRVAQDMHSAGLERWSLQTLCWKDNRFQSKVEYATYTGVPDRSGAVCCLSLTTYDLRIFIWLYQKVMTMVSPS